MYFLWLLLLISPQLLALSRAQDSAYNGLRMYREAASTPTLFYINSNNSESTTQPPVTTQLTEKASTAFSATTNIFERFLTKSHTTRSSVQNLANTTTEGLWLMRATVNKTTGASSVPPTTTKRSYRPTYSNILTKYITIATATTKATETTATTAKTTFIMPTTTSETTTTIITIPTTTKSPITIPTTTTTKSTSTTTTKTSEKPKLNLTSTHRHVLHSGHHWSPTTIRSIANPKPHFSIPVVFLVVLGIFSEYI